MLGEKQKQWLQALRSGQYSQCKKFLCTPYPLGYCCLGVGCEIFGIPKLQSGSVVTFDGENSTSPKLRDILKLYNRNGAIRGYKNINIEDFMKSIDVRNLQRYIETTYGLYNVSPALTAMNDCGLTFKQIADIIEKFPTLFFSEPV